VSKYNSPLVRLASDQLALTQTAPLRQRTHPLASPGDSDAPAQLFVRLHVAYDVAAVAQLIAPILGYDAQTLRRELSMGPIIDGPHIKADADALASTLGHFGVACELETMHSLGQLPCAQATTQPNPVGRYVYGAARRPSDRTSAYDKTGNDR
jgi:hypothetical protein